MASISKTRQRIAKSPFMRLYRKNLYYGTNLLFTELGSSGDKNLNLVRSLALHLTKVNKKL